MGPLAEDSEGLSAPQQIAAANGGVCDLASAKNQRTNLRRAKGTKPNSPALRSSSGGSGVTVVPVVEKRLVTELTAEPSPVVPPPSRMSLDTVSEPTGAKVAMALGMVVVPACPTVRLPLRAGDVDT